MSNSDWGLLAGSHSQPWTSIVGDEHRVLKAVEDMSEDWGGDDLLKVVKCVDADSFLQTLRSKVPLWNDGYDDVSLKAHREEVSAREVTRNDNSTDLIRALRNGDDVVTNEIVKRVFKCV